MKHSKEFKRKDGTKVLIWVSIITDFFRNEHEWSFTIATKAPRKRKWDYDSALPMDHTTLIEQTQLELWQMLKPKKLY